MEIYSLGVARRILVRPGANDSIRFKLACKVDGPLADRGQQRCSTHTVIGIVRTEKISSSVHQVRCVISTDM